MKLAHPRPCAKLFMAAEGQLEHIGKGQQIHTMGQCEKLLGSYCASFKWCWPTQQPGFRPHYALDGPIQANYPE